MEEQPSQFTPMIDDPYQMPMTPININTPLPGAYDMAGGQSHYSVYGGGMTPGGPTMSPGYGPNYSGGMTPMSPYPGGGMSPAVGTPSGMSPGYQPYQSPIYQPTPGNVGGAGSYQAMRSPAHNMASSPSYSPTNSRQSPSYNQHFTPAYQATGGYSGASPAYYSSSGMGSQGTAGRPGGASSYSPTTYSKFFQINKSLNYRRTSAIFFTRVRGRCHAQLQQDALQSELLAHTAHASELTQVSGSGFA
jgi:hypothetical protein